MTGADHRLAVYGTLRPGEANHHVLAPLGGTWRSGSVRGHRIDRATYGGQYPAVTLDPAGESVPVMVLESDALPAEWPRLDEFEGPAYRRVSAEVTLDSGERIEATIYVLADRAGPSA